MSTLFVIPAKAHSSRVPGKNLRLLGGKPLFLWTVEAALDAKQDGDVVCVSTDSDEIAARCRTNGSLVVRRPPELCVDPAQAPDVALHALNEYEKIFRSPDTVCMLLPTSPFRAAQHIREAMALHRHNVVSVCEAGLSHKLVQMEPHRMLLGPPIRSCMPSENYLLNGAIWIASAPRLRSEGFFDAETPYVMDEESGLDIDTELDWMVAEAIIAKRAQAKKPCYAMAADYPPPAPVGARMKSVRYRFDLDGTLCTETNGEYSMARPILHRIARLRELRDQGAYIIIDTARGSVSGYDRLDATTCQLSGWGVPYDELHVGRKPFAHVHVGDEAISDGEFFGDAIQDRWPDSYYEQRHGNDAKRQRAFVEESRLMIRHITGSRGPICDVGCSTGEFFDVLHWWEGPRHGVEVSHVARRAARKRGIDFTRTIYTERDYFDCVIFRGTLQHLPSPFEALQRAHRSLKSGGHLAILATPNTDSWCYRLLGNFPPPLNDAPRNYWMPSSRQLQNALRNYGFEIVAVEYPYLSGPYARPLHDAVSFVRALFDQWVPFSFPGNMMNLIARRP